MLPWRRATVSHALRLVRVPLVGAIVAGVALFAIGVTRPVALVAFMTCALVVTGILYEWTRGTLARRRGGEEIPVAFVRLLSANRPRYGGYVVHLAIIMLAVGAIASSFYSVQRDFVMRPGDTESVGDYRFTFIGMRHMSFPDRQEDYARFEVVKGDDYLGIMEALRAEYPAFRIASTQGAIHSTPVEDFYIVPSELDREGQAVFRVLINPMVWWMWASGPILVLGTLFALSPRRRPAPATAPVGTGARTVRA